MNHDELSVLEAEFDRSVRHYWLTSGTVILVLGVVTIPLIPFWLVFGLGLTERYLKNMKCTLTDRSLKLHKGIMVRTEKTVPLDKITDLGFVQGPIMRLFGLESISVETAGQSGPGSLISVIGIDGARDFRDRVLKQRESYLNSKATVAEDPSPTVAIEASNTAVLTEIRDTLLRIDESLRQRPTD